MDCSTSELTTTDGLNLFLRHWEIKDPQGVVVLVHGLGEHSGRYNHVAEAFNQHKLVVFGFDHRGHGLSSGERGVISRYQNLMDDIALVLSKARTLYPELPRFLYGHSMGGNLALNFLLTQPHALSGVVASAPALIIKPKPLQGAMSKLLNNIKPFLTVPNGLQTTALSRREKTIREYTQDPLVHDRISIRLGHSLIHSGKRIRWMASTLVTPLLLMHGSNDTVCLPEGSREFAAKAGSYCTYREWPHLFHELHNEPEQEQVLNHVIQWLLPIIAEKNQEKNNTPPKIS